MLADQKLLLYQIKDPYYNWLANTRKFVRIMAISNAIKSNQCVALAAIGQK